MTTALATENLARDLLFSTLTDLAGSVDAITFLTVPDEFDRRHDIRRITICVD